MVDIHSGPASLDHFGTTYGQLTIGHAIASGNLGHSLNLQAIGDEDIDAEVGHDTLGSKK